MLNPFALKMNVNCNSCLMAIREGGDGEIECEACHSWVRIYRVCSGLTKLFLRWSLIMFMCPTFIEVMTTVNGKLPIWILKDQLCKARDTNENWYLFKQLVLQLLRAFNLSLLSRFPFFQINVDQFVNKSIYYDIEENLI